jgi:Uma2 family endonuclease
MAIPHQYLPHYTYEEYAQWEGRWELIEGLPYAMSPMPGMEHQEVNGNLFALFKHALKDCSRCKSYLPIDWKIGEDTVLQPDFSIVCDGKPGKYIEHPPALVAEILSPSTAQKDRHVKFEIYQSQAVPYYLIIDPAFKKVEIYTLENGKYILQPQGEICHFQLSDCSAHVSFAALW